jgi:hypothetical protein
MKSDDCPGQDRRKLNLLELVAALVILVIATIAVMEAVRLPFGGLHAPDAGFIPVIEATVLN